MDSLSKSKKIGFARVFKKYAEALSTFTQRWNGQYFSMAKNGENFRRVASNDAYSS